MTNKNEGENNNPSQSLWTTWEDLLLSCAVKRYGLSDWSIVATELQSRVNNNLFTAQICAHKFHDLKTRFSFAGDDENVGDVPWLDELKNLRIKELKEIVQGRGVSIQSLNLKVKRLEEEREKSEKEDEESDKEKPDLDAERSENDKNAENDVALAEKDENVGDVVGDSVSGDRENRSVNESNSTDKKMMETETEAVRTGGNESGEDKDKPVEPVQADSWNDSSKPSEEKKAENESVKVVESAGGESKGAKDSNEAQSSASLTRKSRSSNSNSGGGDGGRGSGSGGNDQMASKNTSRDSEQMNRFLESIRSRKCGSVFETRLQSQKTERYNSIIRQHVDLETVQSRLTNGTYSSCITKFFLDLLLVCNNAIVFYSKSSPEAVAAVELRKFVLKGLNKMRSAKKSNPSPDSAPTTLHKSKPDTEKSDSLLAKQKNTAPIIVCRKRSSITSKPSASNKPQKPDDKQVLDTKQPPVRPSSSSPNEEESLLKLNPKEKPVTGARSMRRSSSARINNATNTSAKNTTVKTPMTSPGSNPGSSTIKGPEAPKAENKKKTNPLLMKKREAADFLKRIKKSSPGKGTLLDSLKSLPENSNSSSKREAREPPKRKVDERKESTRGRQKGGGGGKRAKEEEASQSKRNVGRPPKRGREEGAATGKRGKEVVEEEVVAKRPNKRGRR